MGFTPMRDRWVSGCPGVNLRLGSDTEFVVVFVVTELLVHLGSGTAAMSKGGKICDVSAMF